MAIVSRKEQDPRPDGDSGAGPGPEAPATTTGTAPGEAPPAPRERMHNLPLKTAPVVGRKAEMQRIVQIFDRIRREGRPRRVEVVGRPGVGATTVAVELSRRAGRNFPGGAWYVHLGMGADVAWAMLDAQRGGGPVRDLAAAARRGRERLGEEPKPLLVLDGARSAEEASAALPPPGDAGADVFLVAETPLGTVDADQVCEVTPVPAHAARRIAQAMIRGSQPDAVAPPVRTLDGLALTASLASRAALAYQGREGALSVDDTRNAMMRLVRLVARHPTALELMLLSAVAHPVALPVDGLVAGLRAVRQGRGKEPTPDEAGQGVMWLAHAGIVDPLDEQHFSMHPLVQEVILGMAGTPQDLEVARDALSTGLVAEAEASIGADGVDLPRSGYHHLRHLVATASGEAKARSQAAVAKLDAALGVAGAGA